MNVSEFERALQRASRKPQASTYGRNQRAVTMQTIQTDDVTISEVHFESGFDGKAFVGTGSAKRCPGDTREWATGARLATGRAFIELGIRLMQEASDE